MIKKFDVEITPFQLGRRIHIYLPDDYEQSEERYPVIYMYDGHNLFYDSDATYGKSWGIKDFLDNYDKKFIVVGMECNHEGSKRLDEYCPYTLSQSHLGNIQGQGVEYMEWVVNELKPYIDATYRTLSSRENTMIAGSSMGGLMSLYSVIKHNDVFSKAACLSSSIGLCMNEIKQEIADSQLNVDTKIYLDWGSEEYWDKKGLAYSTARNLEISHILTQRGLNTYPCIVIDGIHNEATWEKQVPEFMEYLWK